MNIHNLSVKNLFKGGSTRCWLVLGLESLKWFKDEDQQIMLVMIPLDGSSMAI